GVAGDAPQRAVRDGGAAELWRRGPGVHDPAGTPDAVDDRMGAGRYLVAPRPKPLRQSQTGDRVLLLGGDRESEQWWVLLVAQVPLGRLTCRGECFVEQCLGERVHLVVDLL